MAARLRNAAWRYTTTSTDESWRGLRGGSDEQESRALARAKLALDVAAVARARELLAASSVRFSEEAERALGALIACLGSVNP